MNRTHEPPRERCRSLFFAGRHHGAHHVAGRETVDRLAPHQIAARKSIGGEAGPLVRATTVGCDQQRWLLPAANGGDLVHVAGTDRVERVALRDREPVPVEFRPAAAAGRDRNPGSGQCAVERPSRRVDGRGVFERRFELLPDLRKPCGILREKVLDRPVILFLLQEIQASTRLEARSDPPRERGWT